MAGFLDPVPARLSNFTCPSHLSELVLATYSHILNECMPRDHSMKYMRYYVLYTIQHELNLRLEIDKLFLLFTLTKPLALPQYSVLYIQIDKFFVLFDVNESESISYDEMRSGLYTIFLYCFYLAVFRHLFLLFLLTTTCGKASTR
jgi:hypothetical protein